MVSSQTLDVSIFRSLPFDKCAEQRKLWHNFIRSPIANHYHKSTHQFNFFSSRMPTFQQKTMTWTFGIILCIVFISSAFGQNETSVRSGNQTRHCFVCYSCNRVEQSQSIECPPEHDLCMVSFTKIHTVLSNLNRQP